MRPLLYCLAAGGLLGLFGQSGTAGGKLGTPGVPKAIEPGAVCGDYGTSVNFVATPSDAAKKADKDQKLVFVLHVSGNFETPEFT